MSLVLEGMVVGGGGMVSFGLGMRVGVALRTMEVSSSLDALAGSRSSRPLQATPLASRAPFSSRRPLQARTVRADIHRCGSELSEKDLVDLRARYEIPPISDALASEGHRLDQCSSPMTEDFFSCLLAGVTPMAEFFLTSFSQRTQKDGFLYFIEMIEMKGFCEAFSSKVEPDTWRPFFFYASGEGLRQGVPFGFMGHPKSHSALPRSAKHKADALAFSTY
ncbi:hypothetical protein LIER_24790 [Lithospermum erythrorhizon]|uniref:Uncharacterized protein n=1 Tax=Lithospermum erythrorhizon TaxID=34254 RepID=A0AAV3R2K9_LITER